MNALLSSLHSPLVFTVGPFDTLEDIEKFAANTELPEEQGEAEVAGALPMVDFTATVAPEPEEPEEDS